MKTRLLIVLLASVVSLAGCNKPQQPNSDKQAVMNEEQVLVERWYSQTQTNRGYALYQSNCAECHRADASGTLNWKQPNPDGKFPPPPLNGSAHTWHHSLSVLRRTVRLGGVRLGGTMPGFADKLNSEQIDDILAWVQSHWSDQIYRVWHERNAQDEKRQRLSTQR